MKIFLAAGHGGSDPGAKYGKKNERDIAISIVEHAKSWLKGLYGVTPIIVPHNLRLKDTIKWINARSSGLKDRAIEVHLNSDAAHKGKGTETYYYAGSSTSKAFAITINSYVRKYLKSINRGVKPDTSTRFGRLGFVRDTKPLAILLEAFFIQENYSTNRAGKGLAVGIAKHCGFKQKKKNVKTKKITFKVPVNLVSKITAFVKKLLSKK